VERAVAEAPLLSDTSFAAAIHTSVRRILDESKVAKTNPETGTFSDFSFHFRTSTFLNMWFKAEPAHLCQIKPGTVSFKNLLAHP
jgi:hypothetical protein